MASRHNLAIWLAVTAACLAVGVLLLAPIFLCPDHYWPDVISYFERNTGKKLEIERLALTFFPRMAVHIDGFGVKCPPLFPPSYIFKVTHADAVFDFWSLLHRRVVIRSVSLEDPEINLVSDPDGPWNFENPETANSKNTFLLGIIDKVVIARGHLIVSNLLPSDAAGPVFFEADDITSELDSVNLAAIVNPTSPLLNGKGTWKAGRLRFGSVETTNVNCKFWLEAKEIFFTALSADAYGGKITGNFSVNLAKKQRALKRRAE